MNITAATVIDGITRLQACGVALPKDIALRSHDESNLEGMQGWVARIWTTSGTISLRDETAELFAAWLVWWLMTEKLVWRVEEACANHGKRELPIMGWAATVPDGPTKTALDPFSACVVAIEQAHKMKAGA